MPVFHNVPVISAWTRLESEIALVLVIAEYASGFASKNSLNFVSFMVTEPSSSVITPKFDK